MREGHDEENDKRNVWKKEKRKKRNVRKKAKKREKR